MEAYAVMTTKEEVGKWIELLASNIDGFCAMWVEEFPAAPRAVHSAALRLVACGRQNSTRLQSAVLLALSQWQEDLMEEAPGPIHVVELHIKTIIRVFNDDASTLGDLEVLGAPRDVMRKGRLYENVSLKEPDRLAAAKSAFDRAVGDWIADVACKTNEMLQDIAQAKRWEQRVKVLEKRLDDIRDVAAGGRPRD